MPKPARDAIMAHAKSLPGTRGKAYLSTPDEEGASFLKKGAVNSAGRPYNMRDVSRARSLLRTHGVKASRDQAENLLDEALHT